MQVAILGKTGMLGAIVVGEFVGAGFDVVGTTREQLDAQTASVEDIENVIAGVNYVVNCIGIIKPYIHDDNSAEVQRAVIVNSLFPHRLAQASNRTGAKVIQIATDCVYDGVNGGYVEHDKHNATDVYGKTKSLGEVSADNFLNLRCSIIGREEKGYLSLLEWFLRQPKGAKLNGFKNHFWNGITTKAFAKICVGIIQNDAWFYGLQHVVPADIMDKADLLREFAMAFDRNDVHITDANTQAAVDRTIQTINPPRNQELWQHARYAATPTISQMIREI